jgi:hypothetical protein
MNAFLDAIDLSENISRGVAAVRGLRGLSALITAAALGLICVALAPLCWYFDIDATLAATDTAVSIVVPTLPGEWASAASLVALGLTLMPTLIELFGARFAMAGIRVAAGLVYFFSAFDALTDYPRVAAFCEAYRAWFEGLGVLAGIAFFVFRALFLFLATFGFELLFVVFAVCAFACLAQAGRRRSTVEDIGATI